jgi:hypothetical protein
MWSGEVVARWFALCITAALTDMGVNNSNSSSNSNSVGRLRV